MGSREFGTWDRGVYRRKRREQVVDPRGYKTGLVLTPLTRLQVYRSRKIESDRHYQKNKERVQELKVLWKKKKLLSAINKYIETFDTSTIISFYFTDSHFQDFNSSPLFSCGSPFLYSFYFLSRTWILSVMKTSTNLVRVARRTISFH